MKLCDSCGGQIDPAHPFRVCPTCLLGEALTAQPDTPDSDLVDAANHSARRVVAPGRLPRRDFFQKYEVLERVARGGQGDLLKVWDFELRRCVAMKRLTAPLHADDLVTDPALYRFLAEAQITSQLEHPGILPVFDIGLDPDEKPFYTTQLLPGTTLSDVWIQARRGDDPWTINRAVELLVRVCEVVAHAHSRGVIHRDLKPANVLVGAFGDVRVIDWGSAYVLKHGREHFEESLVPLNRDIVQTDRGEALSGDLDSPLATARSGYPFTPVFMPPEILSGTAIEPSPLTDVYSVGVMLYQLLTGRVPYSDTEGEVPKFAELRERILRGPPTPVRTLNPSVSRDLAAICAKAMAQDPVNRYRTIQDLSDDLRAALETRPVRARKPGPWLILQKWVRRNAGYVALGGLMIVIAAAAFAVSQGLKSQRDLARRVAEVNDALGKAELAARTGQWRAALDAWDNAEAAGYRDRVQLGLRRAEAWTVLGESDRAQAELTRLARRPDLGDQRGAVLVRLGERELSLRATSEQGVQRIQEALTAGLEGADLTFAQALLAETTPEALALFRQTLQLNPFHHGAHTYSLGLEHLLGRHQEVAEHLRVFKALFPDDPSGILIEASVLALEGNLAEAQARFDQAETITDAELLDRLRSSFRILTWAARHYDIEAQLAERASDPAEDDQFLAQVSSLFGSWDPSAGSPSFPGVRMPYLPCFQAGLHEAMPALHALAFPLWGDLDSVVAKIKSSWRHHPEATVPMFAATFLDPRHPREGPKSLFLLAIQAELFQLAADSPSILPSFGRTTLYRAAQSHFELVTRNHPNAAASREACLANVRRAAALEDLSAAEGRAYFEMAFSLGDYDLARDVLKPWQTQKPGDPDALRARVRLELATGAFGNALELLDSRLTEEPEDPWAREHRQRAINELDTLLNSARSILQPSQ